MKTYLKNNNNFLKISKIYKKQSKHFIIYYKYIKFHSKFKIIISKKYAKRAVTRNLIRRIAKEIFRLKFNKINNIEILLYLYKQINIYNFPSASSKKLKFICQTELNILFNKILS